MVIAAYFVATYAVVLRARRRILSGHSAEVVRMYFGS